ncbi:MAG TPA: type II secretion system F family protein [Chloroflexota bacterium]|nr:type II secretion system F family protein [Chloroflexota bacterium]
MIELLAGLGSLNVRAIDARVILWPLLFGLGCYLLLLTQAWARPKPDLGEMLRLLDVEERLKDVDDNPAAARPLFAWRPLENMLRPVVEDAGRLLRGVLVPLGLAGGQALEARLRVARPGVEPVQFFGEKIAAGAILAAVFPLLNVLRIHPFGPWPVWVWLVGFGVGYLLPDWDLQRRAAARRGLVLMELPTILDMLTLATSAGMALEQALEEVARHSEGLVARELRLVLRELALGQRRSLDEGLRAMAERLGLLEFERVIGRMGAAYEQGLPLTQALAAQAQALREQQRLHVAEEGGKASVRMLLPVAILILPVLFVVVLVPAAAELTRLGG